MGANGHGLLGIYTEIFKPGNAIIEIGCGKHSTPLLYDIARKTQQTFYACDNQHPEIAEIGQDNEDFIYVDLPGEEFLANHFQHNGERISAAYLDNFDWMYQPEIYRTENKPDFLNKLVKEYAENGLDLNNVNSSMAHLTQSILIDRYSAEQCAILFDDTWFDYTHEVYLGKGSAAVIYLLNRGWRVAQEISPQSHAVMVTKNIDPFPWKPHAVEDFRYGSHFQEDAEKSPGAFSGPHSSSLSSKKRTDSAHTSNLRSAKRPHRLIVTASIGRSWNPHGEASARHWAHRVGAEFYIRNEPYIIDKRTLHPWFIKWDILADAVEARQPDEVVWLDDDIVIRADTGWPTYEKWAIFEVAAGHDLGNCAQKNGALEASRISGIPWNCSDGYYNTGLVFRRNPGAGEFRELGQLARRIPLNLIPDQAALAVHLARRTGVRRLPLIWHVRGPTPLNGYLPGYINHFLGGKWDNMNRLGPLWTKVPRTVTQESDTCSDVVSHCVQMAIDAIENDDPKLAQTVLIAARERLSGTGSR